MKSSRLTAGAFFIREKRRVKNEKRNGEMVKWGIGEIGPAHLRLVNLPKSGQEGEEGVTHTWYK
jgi:hypothetical protein